MYNEITSRTNGRVRFATELAKSPALRQSEGLFFAEGAKLCLDLAKSLVAKTVFFTEKALVQNVELASIADEAYLVQPHVAEKLSLTKSTQGVFVLFEKPIYSALALQAAHGIVLCENLQDPGNVGTVLRTAAGLGYGGIVLCGDSADPFSPKALRASSGAVARLPILVEKDTVRFCTALKKSGVALYASALNSAAKPLQNSARSDSFALIIGNEGSGISREILDLSDEIVYLPMQNGVESLNAGAAAAVFMYHYKTDV